jgi:hypothetical protein
MPQAAYAREYRHFRALRQADFEPVTRLEKHLEAAWQAGRFARGDQVEVLAVIFPNPCRSPLAPPPASDEWDWDAMIYRWPTRASRLIPAGGMVLSSCGLPLRKALECARTAAGGGRARRGMVLVANDYWQAKAQAVAYATAWGWPLPEGRG